MSNFNIFISPATRKLRAKVCRKLITAQLVAQEQEWQKEEAAKRKNA